MVQYDIFRKHRGNHKVDPLLILGFPGLKMRSLFLGEKSQVLIQGFLEIIPSVLEIGFDLRYTPYIVGKHGEFHLLKRSIDLQVHDHLELREANNELHTVDLIPFLTSTSPRPFL